jgi:hypothetical protein
VTRARDVAGKHQGDQCDDERERDKQRAPTTLRASSGHERRTYSSEFLALFLKSLQLKNL